MADLQSFYLSTTIRTWQFPRLGLLHYVNWQVGHQVRIFHKIIFQDKQLPTKNIQSPPHKMLEKMWKNDIPFGTDMFFF